MDIEAFNSIAAAWQRPEESAEFPRRLPLDSVELLPEVFQPRSRRDSASGVEDQHHVETLSRHLRANPDYDLDAVTVLPIQGRYILIEGHHRLAAYKLRGRSNVPVEVFRGTPDEALIHSGSVNRRDHLDMTAADRSQRAWELVCSQRPFKVEQIVDGSGVSSRTVKTMRSKLKDYTEQGQEPPETWHEVLHGKAAPDPDWVDKKVEEYRQKLTKAWGPSKGMNSGKKSLLAEALMAWGDRTALYIAQEILERHMTANELSQYLRELEEEARAEEAADSEEPDF